MTDLHLHPVNDTIQHEISRDCVCGPEPCGDLIIHQPLQPMTEDDDED